MGGNSKRLEKSVKQQAFLSRVNELKHEIFEQFSPTITKESKKKAWSLIRDYAVSIGLITHDKDFTYVRDATWPNLRNRTMIKIDKSKKTGEGGGSDSKLDECDKLVLEIIGQESPVIQGIGVCDSLEQNDESNEKKTTSPIPLSVDEHTIPYHVPITRNDAAETNLPKNYVKKRVIVRKLQDTKSLEDIKKRKLLLEIRKLQLEVWEKENLLGVDHCAETKDEVCKISNGNNKMQGLVLEDSGNVIVINNE